MKREIKYFGFVILFKISKFTEKVLVLNLLMRTKHLFILRVIFHGSPSGSNWSRTQIAKTKY